MAGRVNADKLHAGSLLHCTQFKNCCMAYIEEMEEDRQRMLARKRREKRAAATTPTIIATHKQRAATAAELGKKESEVAGMPIRASRLQKFVNNTLLPKYYSSEHVDARAQARAERLNITNVADVQKTVADALQNARTAATDRRISVRTAQRWLNQLGLKFHKHPAHGMFIDYINRRVM